MVNVLNDMAKLAIKGHLTRGKEIIEILGMLGGSNAFNHDCDNSCAIYYIDETYKNYVICDVNKRKSVDYAMFTLEEFLEKFPYKVGDKVSSKYLKNYEIEKMEWDDTNNRVIYKLRGMGWYSADELQPYKEETMDKANKVVFEANAQCCDISNKIIKKETMGKEISGAIVDRFICLEGYDFYDDKGNIIDTKEITMKKKQPKYPKTFVECAKILDCFGAAHIDGYKNELLEKLQELIICRDAYWKITGDWKPNFANVDEKFIIACYYGKIYTTVATNYNMVLVFPTEEMRDAFYENFKDLIESCKELL